MLVQTAANSTLKIILSPNEAKNLFGNASPSLRSKDTQRILSALFSKIAKRLNFKPSTDKLLVELIRQQNGGYLFSFTNTAQGRLKAVVLEFENVDDILCALKLLPSDKKIYSFENKYRVVARLDEEKLLRLSEFCSSVYYSSTEIARTKEYGKPTGF